jgi:hypothetical protein
MGGFTPDARYSTRIESKSLESKFMDAVKVSGAQAIKEFSAQA